MGIEPLKLKADLEGSTYCLSCKKEFDSEDELDNHHATSCKKPPLWYKFRFTCLMCKAAPGPRFLTRFLLAEHIEAEHIAKKGKKKGEAKGASTGEEPAKEVTKKSGTTKRGNRRSRRRNRMR